MRSVVAALAVLVAAGLAGCLDDVNPFAGRGDVMVPATAMAADPLSPYAREPGPQDAADPAVLSAGTMLAWEMECPCPEQRFLALPRAGEWVEVRVRWDGTTAAGMFTYVVDEAWNTHYGERGFDDYLVRMWDVQGDLWLRINGEGPVAITARLGTTELPSAGPLLPDLVELVLEGAHVGQCDAVEQSEQGAVECLRFGNGVGNPGHGPVQVRLTLDQAAMALGQLSGRYDQEVLLAGGGVDSHEVGPASFHVSHGHWHYDGLALFELFHVDIETGLRGGLAAAHGKSGFCFLDWDEMPENVTTPDDQQRAETDCLVPGLSTLLAAQPSPPTWTNGISRGWYDFYVSALSDQYVDIAGLPEGLYELVATADPLDTLVELDETNNQSSLLLHIDGARNVEVIQERGHFRVQEDDDA